MEGIIANRREPEVVFICNRLWPRYCLRFVQVVPGLSAVLRLKTPAGIVGFREVTGNICHSIGYRLCLCHNIKKSTVDRTRVRWY